MADSLENLLRDCTVRVTGGPMSGAGFFVAPGKVLTCAHVIGDSAALVVKWVRDRQPTLVVQVSGQVTVLADRGRPIPALDWDYPDIAVLQVDGLDGHPCVDLDPEWPSGEDSFLVFGYPMEGGAVRLTPARLTYRGTQGTHPTAYLDLASDTIKPGMSGAAVLNLRTGAVCGVVVASKHPAHPDGALAIPWSAIAADLGQVLAANRAFQLQDRRWDEATAAVPGHRGKIVVYLRALVDWLGSDAWPQDKRLGGPMLTPAAIERKLRVTATDEAGEQDLDADDLAKQCQRLVILGGPGSGKSWLARRTARRCAEDALKALAEGATIDEIELPLYTTCSRLLNADGDIREAAVSSAVGQLGDLGSPRVRAALRESLTERKSPTLLVIDSLDEAHGSDERLRQADTLPWRIILTSRPGSWNHQLIIEKENDSHRVGELQPLRYPDDVEFFIRRWFAGQPDWGGELAAQIAQRPGLQQAATVPLILALYCIVGGGEPLPEFRRDLYPRVLKRMLIGRWRGSDDHQRDVDVDTCLQTLGAWAWHGATNHPISGVGTWMDDIPTECGRLGGYSDDALDHVAAPLGLPDIDTGKTLRRFVHWSVREHLVAEHVAGLPLDEAVEALLPHVWYDRDWEYSAPAALAMHPRHDQLLLDLICRAANSDHIPRDLSVIDGGWQFRWLLAQVADESSEADWSPEVAEMIGKARVELASAGASNLGRAASWGASNRQARAALLRLLADETDDQVAIELAHGLAELDPTTEDKRQARAALLGLLADEPTPGAVVRLTAGLAQLGPTAEDLRQACDSLVALLGRPTYGVGAFVEVLVSQVAKLAPTAEDRRQACAALLGLLGRATYGPVATALAGGIAQLEPTAEDTRQARAALLGLLVDQTNVSWADGLAGGIAQLAPTAEDRRQARAALLGLLVDQTNVFAAKEVVGGLGRLDPTAEDTRQARAALLGLLANETHRMAIDLADGVAELEPTTDDRRQARAALLGLLARETNVWAARGLARGLARLATTAEDMREARAALLGLLAADHTDGPPAAGLTYGVAQLDPTAGDKRQACAALLRLLANEADDRVAIELADGVAELDPTAEDKRQARAALLERLACNQHAVVAEGLVVRLAQLEPTAHDIGQARAVLLALLARETDGSAAKGLPDVLDSLGPTAEDKRQARDALLGLLARETDRSMAECLASALAQLAPTVGDLRTWRAWAALPTVELLDAMRQNSAPADWLAALPWLSSLSS